MKRSACLALVLAATIGSTSTFAGSLSDPVVAPKIIVEDATSSSSGSTLVSILAWLILIPVVD